MNERRNDNDRESEGVEGDVYRVGESGEPEPRVTHVRADKVVRIGKTEERDKEVEVKVEEVEQHEGTTEG